MSTSTPGPEDDPATDVEPPTDSAPPAGKGAPPAGNGAAPTPTDTAAEVVPAPAEAPPHAPDDELPTPDDELPELAPHLRDRPDRPRDVSDIARGRSQARLILLLLFAALPFVVLVVVVLNSLASGPPDRSVQAAQGGLNEVTRYCTYTTQTGGDYDNCLKTADYRVIQKEQTNGARYARGELTRCLPDAGPRCVLR